MKVSIIFNLIFLINILQAQDTTIFAPSGSIWSYSGWVQQPYPDLLTFVSDGEIILNGITARVLKFYKTEGDKLEPVDTLNKFVYTSGNKVYYWVEDGFYLLYDFGAQPGDTIHSRVGDFPVLLSCFSDFSDGPLDFGYRIDSVGLIEIDGQTLRMQHVSPVYTSGDIEWLIESPVIERFGQLQQSAYWWGRGGGCFLGGFPGELRCYEDAEIFFKNPYTQFNLECDYVSTVESILKDQKPIYPNPTKDFITLTAISEVIHIYDSIGKKVKYLKNQSQVNVADLYPNIYFIQYKIDGIWHTGKFLKI